MKKFVTISDVHFPFQKEKAINSVKEFVRNHKVDEIILLGDIVDFYDLSSFDKNPNRINCLQIELDLVKQFLTSLREENPKAKITYIVGNHEDRLRRYIWSHTELHTLSCLDLKSLLGLEELDIQLLDNYTTYGILFTHGSVVRKFSGYSAKEELTINDCSGISGHTHRLGMVWRSTPSRDMVWIENGCLCDKEQCEYMDRLPDWQLGFTYGVVDEKGNNPPLLLPIKLQDNGEKILI